MDNAPGNDSMHCPKIDLSRPLGFGKIAIKVWYNYVSDMSDISPLPQWLSKTFTCLSSITYNKPNIMECFVQLTFPLPLQYLYLMSNLMLVI